MAQLKDTVIQGSLSVSGNTTTNDIILRDSKNASQVLAAPTAGGVPYWHALINSDVGLGNVSNDLQVKNSIGSAKGDMFYWIQNDSSSTPAYVPARLSIGTSGQVLTSKNGVPTWCTGTQKIDFTFVNNDHAINVTVSNATTNTIVTNIVVTSGIEKLTDYISWSSSANKITLTIGDSTDTKATGQITGYIITESHY